VFSPLSPPLSSLFFFVFSSSLQSCQLIPNPETGKHKGYGFVEFETEDAAKGAIQCMNGFQLGGRQLKVGVAVCLLD